MCNIIDTIIIICLFAQSVCMYVRVLLGGLRIIPLWDVRIACCAIQNADRYFQRMNGMFYTCLISVLSIYKTFHSYHNAILTLQTVPLPHTNQI